jgi:hypothetical protein
MRVSLDRQRELYDAHCERAVDELLGMLGEQRAALITLGRQRAFEQVGVHEYGDSTYFRTPEQLVEEVAAELADAIFYLTVGIARRAGELPDPDEPASIPPPLD